MDTGVPFPYQRLLPIGEISTENSLVPETGHQVVVHHPCRLHEGVADRGAHEGKTPLFQVPAHVLRLRGDRRDMVDLSPPIFLRFSPDQTPDISVETPLLLPNLYECP